MGGSKRHHSLSRSRKHKSKNRSRSLRRSASHSPPPNTPSPVRNNNSDVNNTIQQSLSVILSRLDALENNGTTRNPVANSESISNSNSAGPYRDCCEDVNLCGASVNAKRPLISTDCDDNESRGDSTLSTAQALVDAIKTIAPSRSQYYVSNFDPAIHDIDSWFEEVDRAKVVNNWDDRECLSRVALCLKGDAKVWLSEWSSNDRSWSNFKVDFRSLCPNKLDYANILFETMNTTSDKYNTYAEYARRTLLRLRIVKGLSEDLITQITIRGITDAQVRAAAANANLTPDNLVSFLSIYVKPGHGKQDSKSLSNRKRDYPQSNNKYLPMKCHSCGQVGHKSKRCFKKPRHSEGETSASTVITCTFCKKPGHTQEKCFAKERSESRNKHNVNLCSEKSLENKNNSKDVVPAVVQGIPVDVLIDSGAINVSLISSDVVKYFSCVLKPTSCVLKGISNQEILTTAYVTLTIEFDEISVEADLVVVPASCMNTPIIIGTDVLNRDGITYVRSRNKQYLTRSEPLCKSIVSAVTEVPKINTPLQGADRAALIKVIDTYSQFFISGTATTTVTTGKLHITLTSNAPVTYRPYRLSFREKCKVREIVKDLLDKGIIRESQSEYASPVILVKKKDGSDRMCVDYRALNQLTVKDRYPLPLIDDHIDRLGSYGFFTSLDMATGFHQIPIDEESIPLTGFVTPEGHYEYVKMPYGLANSPIVYQRIINNTLRRHIDSGHVLVYIDDVLIMSSNVKHGIELLSEVLKTLTEAGFSINLKKCTFLTTEVEYLGRVISRGQVKPSPDKIKALVNSPTPENVRQVRQFLGLAGYFRRYIRNYATKTACISKLTKTGVPFEWGSEQEIVRRELITLLTSEPILSIFDPELPTEVHTDASSAGYGAVLLQTRENGTKAVVSYFSKVTQGAESRYHSYELETLAVVKALQNFRHYLIGISFKVVTDCNALKSTQKKKDLLPRVARWWVYLQDYNFSIEYRKGVLMSHADYLSRNPPVKVNQITKPRNWAQIAQSADNETQELLQKLQDGQLDSHRYIHQNGLLYYRYSPVGQDARLLCFVPKGFRLSLLRIFHDEHEHICAEKTSDLILKHFWFPGIHQFVKKYIAHCLVCVSQKRVPRAPHQMLTSWQKSDVPFDTIHVDALGPLPESNGNKFVFVIIDSFTKYCLLYPMHRQDTVELKKVITNAISMFGVPKLIVSDRGRMFESASFVSLIKDLGCDIHYITPEMHQSNGQVERYMRTVLNMLRIEANYRKTLWSEMLWKLQLVLNITKQKTTQTSALNLLIGVEAVTPIIRSLLYDVVQDESGETREARRELCRARARELLQSNRAWQDYYVNKQRDAPKQYSRDDLVFVIKYSQSTGKLDSGMRGPYRVTRVLPSGRYELRLLAGSYGKTTQAAAEYMVPWRGEWCPESCAALFESDANEDSDPVDPTGPSIEGPSHRTPQASTVEHEAEDVLHQERPC